MLKDQKEGFNLSKHEVDDILFVLFNYVKVTESINKDKIINIRDPKDRHIIECALTVGAKFIVTRDKDILVINKYEDIKILDPEKFLEFINKSKIIQ